MNHTHLFEMTHVKARIEVGWRRINEPADLPCCGWLIFPISTEQHDQYRCNLTIKCYHNVCFIVLAALLASLLMSLVYSVDSS